MAQRSSSQDVDDRASLPNAALDILSDIDLLFDDPDYWLRTPNSNFGGRSPQEMLDLGEQDQVRQVLDLIKYIGVS